MLTVLFLVMVIAGACMVIKAVSDNYDQDDDDYDYR